jgi:hypothetical protein
LALLGPGQTAIEVFGLQHQRIHVINQSAEKSSGSVIDATVT